MKAFLETGDIPGPQKKKLPHYLDLISKIAAVMGGARTRIHKLLGRLFGRKTGRSAPVPDPV